MAYLLRSIFVVGVIALNSPVHGERSGEADMAATVRSAARTVAQVDARSAVQGLTAAREAAQILADLDPQTRARMLAVAAAGLKHQTDDREPARATQPR